MKKKRIFSLLIILALVAFTVAGCDFNNNNNDVPVDDNNNNNNGNEVVNVEGTVGINRLGEGDASDISIWVEGEDISTETEDEDGNFSFNLETGESYDIYATRDDLATSKVQNFYLCEEEPITELSFVIQEEASEEHFEDEVPDLTVEGISDLDYIDDIDPPVFLESSEDIRQYGVTQNNSYYDKEVEDRSFTPGDKEVEISYLGLNPDYGGGPQPLVFFIRDGNNNITHEFFHVEMPEAAEGERPDAPDFVEAEAVTINASFNWLVENYGEEQIMEEFSSLESSAEIQTVPEDTSLFVDLFWGDVNDAETYNLYRSFDGSEYHHLDTVSTPGYMDVDSALEAGQRTYYKVKAVNENGEGITGVSTYVEPLPVMEASLISPEGEGAGVDPEFVWDTNTLGFEREEFSYDELNMEFELAYKARDSEQGQMMYDYYSMLNIEDEEVKVEIVNGKFELSVNYSDAFYSNQLERGEGPYHWDLTLGFVEKEISPNSMAVSYGVDFTNRAHPENSGMEFEVD